MKKQLIKLGYANPELRPHLTAILDELTKTSSFNTVSTAGAAARWGTVQHVQHFMDEACVVDTDRHGGVVISAGLARRILSDEFWATDMYEAIKATLTFEEDVEKFALFLEAPEVLNAYNRVCGTSITQDTCKQVVERYLGDRDKVWYENLFNTHK